MMKRRALCALSLAACLWGTQAAAEIELRRCSAVDFPLIFLNLVVRDAAGDPVPDLTTADFECFEDGVLQEELFTSFAPGEGPGIRGADIVFAIDTSGSMSEEIEQVKDNINDFVDGLAERGVTVGLGLIAFGNGPPEVKGGGTLFFDVEEFKALVGGLSITGGEERGFEALRDAVGSFDFSGVAQKIFILVTDEDSDGPGTDESAPEEQQQTIDLLLANEARAFAFADCSVGASARHYCDEGSVTLETGGFQRSVTSDFDDVFKEIEPLISDTYVLRYESGRPDPDPEERTIECAVLRPDVAGTVECTYIPVSAPQIELTPKTRLIKASALEEGPGPVLEVLVTDLVEPLVESVTLFYRTSRPSADGEGYSPIAMVKVGDEKVGDGEIFSAQVPAAVAPGIDFFVRATDGAETSAIPEPRPAREPFHIAVLPNRRPQIAHTPKTIRKSTGGPASAQAIAAPDPRFQLSAVVFDDTQLVEGVELFWRNRGEVLYRRLAMASEDGRTYTVEVPPAEVNELVEYYIRAVDNLGVGSSFGEAASPCPMGEMCTFDESGGVRVIRPRDARRIPRNR